MIEHSVLALSLERFEYVVFIDLMLCRLVMNSVSLLLIGSDLLSVGLMHTLGSAGSEFPPVDNIPHWTH